MLGYFTERQPEFGLSELARTAGFDKASTRRLLLALIKHDYIEQNPVTRAYRLGAGVLRLARVRETSTPLEAITTPLLQELVAFTGETAHFTLRSGGTISTVGLVETTKSNRIHFVLGEEGSLYATASGIVCLAYSDESVISEILKTGLRAYTDQTITDERRFRNMLKTVAKQGYHINQEMFEEGVCSIAAPVFNAQREALGAIAVAAPSSRFGDKAQGNDTHSGAGRRGQRLPCAGCRRRGTNCVTNTSRALVLDFGGVISRTLFETHDITEQALSLPPGSLTWRGPFNPAGDALWVSMQNDELTERDYWAQRTREVGALVGENWTEMSQFVMAARGADPGPVIRPEALAALDEAQAMGRETGHSLQRTGSLLRC